ncbi:hypothetical protein Q5P01_019718 [Channa striata]|uniref:Coiled-coil domain containing 15 n=1 Tax=Channa striata TaxID=64152 RepID=A0AA88M1S0_CHASR|nr:hypothetical protein Q5P01_019718 [Channa striata]
MSANVSRVKASANERNKVSDKPSKEYRPPKTNKVLAERNQAVAAVGAWVEDGQDFVEHPSVLALLTEELQAERRKENEESLRRFQVEVRHRVAQRAQTFKKRQQPHTNPVQQYAVWTQNVSADEKLMSSGGAAQIRVMEGSSQESSEGMRQVRLRLAACRMIPQGDVMSDLPGGKWNISSSKHKPETHVLRSQYEMEEDDTVQEGDGHLFTRQHECPLIQQKMSGHMLLEKDKAHLNSVFKSGVRVPQDPWPLADQEELKRQRQSQFLMHRRLFMNTEREQVKENNKHRKHLKRTARIKAEKEQIRLEEEQKLERVWHLREARQKMEERELLILERLRLEEEERVVEMQRRKREEKGKVAVRFIEALRAQMKERLSHTKLDLPPLCCCAASFWDSHPDTCANNCVFHNNPKAYAQALHSTMWSLGLR